MTPYPNIVSALRKGDAFAAGRLACRLTRPQDFGKAMVLIHRYFKRREAASTHDRSNR